MARSEKLVKACKLFIKLLEDILSRRTVDVWSVPAGLITIHTFPVHIKHFIGDMCNDAALYERCPHIMLLQWYEK